MEYLKIENFLLGKPLRFPHTLFRLSYHYPYASPKLENRKCRLSSYSSHLHATETFCPDLLLASHKNIFPFRPGYNPYLRLYQRISDHIHQSHHRHPTETATLVSNTIFTVLPVTKHTSIPTVVNFLVAITIPTTTTLSTEHYHIGKLQSSLGLGPSLYRRCHSCVSFY